MKLIFVAAFLILSSTSIVSGNENEQNSEKSTENIERLLLSSEKNQTFAKRDMRLIIVEDESQEASCKNTACWDAIVDSVSSN